MVGKCEAINALFGVAQTFAQIFQGWSYLAWILVYCPTNNAVRWAVKEWKPESDIVLSSSKEVS